MPEPGKNQLPPDIQVAMKFAAMERGTTSRTEAVYHVCRMLQWARLAYETYTAIPRQTIENQHEGSYLALQVLGITEDEIVAAMDRLEKEGEEWAQEQKRDPNL